MERYLAEINPNVEIVAYDLDAERIEIAQRTTRPGSRVVAHVGDAIAMSEPGTFDAVIAIDLMHHIPESEHVNVARGFYERLLPGGVCLVKDIATTPRRQYLWNLIHDRVVAGPDPIFCRDPYEMALVFADAGFRLEDARRLKRLDPYPHYLLRLRRRADGCLCLSETFQFTMGGGRSGRSPCTSGLTNWCRPLEARFTTDRRNLHLRRLSASARTD